MIGTGSPKLHGQLRLLAAENTSITDADTYYELNGNFGDGEARGFAVENNKLVYNGPTGICFLFNGVSDVEVNQACEIYYALFVNGVLVEDAQTPHVFVSPSKTSNISITAITRLTQGDILEARVKSDTINTIATIKTFNITFWS